MYGREQTHNQERREQAFCRSTEEPVLNVTNREIPIASRVNDQEYRKLMWAQLVVLVPLALCAISVMWMVIEVTMITKWVGPRSLKNKNTKSSTEMGQGMLSNGYADWHEKQHMSRCAFLHRLSRLISNTDRPQIDGGRRSACVLGGVPMSMKMLK